MSPKDHGTAHWDPFADSRELLPGLRLRTLVPPSPDLPSVILPSSLPPPTLSWGFFSPWEAPPPPNLSEAYFFSSLMLTSCLRSVKLHSLLSPIVMRVSHLYKTVIV